MTGLAGLTQDKRQAVSTATLSQVERASQDLGACASDSGFEEELLLELALSEESIVFLIAIASVVLLDHHSSIVL